MQLYYQLILKISCSQVFIISDIIVLYLLQHTATFNTLIIILHVATFWNWINAPVIITTVLFNIYLLNISRNNTITNLQRLLVLAYYSGHHQTMHNSELKKNITIFLM